MNNQPLQAVILAAGESSRFWPLNSKHKSLLRIMGKPLIWYTINELIKIGVKEAIVVQGPNRDAEKELSNLPLCIENVRYVIQQEPKGMGNAILSAKDCIKGSFFELNASRINCGDIAKLMIECYRKTGAKMVLAGEKTLTPWLYGVARIEGDRVLEIVEKPAEGEEPSNINVTGIRLFDPGIIKYLEAVEGTRSNNDVLEVAMSLFAKENDTRIVMFDGNTESVSFKYPWHLLAVRDYLLNKFLTKKTIAKSAQIAKNAVIEGNVYIGENVKIYEGAVVKGPCYIGDNSIIGNNSIVRDYCDLENGAMVGALCEMLRTILQPDVHVHSGYFGDSILASGVRVGAGAIVANKRNDRAKISARVKKEKNGEKVLSKVDTGMKALGTIIGENSKLGVRVTTMPARFIGKNCQVGPVAVVMRNVDDGAKI
jgi:UDP-N-acetylglucosamine diphosphorylase / glucose-1-phosphate thymidylyltransferase / UDP-N-acetylgalactosamine diphosphorylase / glucosamine-1-phosphate N-acetyltransferase / galactosamine-1-phosphate N-acetyltransferase